MNVNSVNIDLNATPQGGKMHKSIKELTRFATEHEDLFNLCRKSCDIFGIDLSKYNFNECSVFEDSPPEITFTLKSNKEIELSILLLVDNNTAFVDIS